MLHIDKSKKCLLKDTKKWLTIYTDLFPLILVLHGHRQIHTPSCTLTVLFRSLSINAPLQTHYSHSHLLPILTFSPLLLLPERHTLVMASPLINKTEAKTFLHSLSHYLASPDTLSQLLQCPL